MHYERSSWAIVRVCVRDPTFSRFGTVPAYGLQIWYVGLSQQILAQDSTLHLNESGQIT